MSFRIDTHDLALSTDLMLAQAFTVASIPRPYRVTLDPLSDPCASIQACLGADPKNVLIIDQNVYALYGENIDWPETRIFQIPATEVFKGMEGVMALYDFLHQHQITKRETLVVVGGGITQDISGFVAATYKRGLNWVFFPTTLLAMSDSCIGGKAGVYYRGSKNQLALFSSPQEVSINTRFLQTLSAKAIQSGLGEILKLCITGGQSYVDFFQSSLQSGAVKQVDGLQPLIMSALAVKRAVIEVDEFEQGIRKGLNYGHTLGHVIEAMTDYAIPHGIAVVIGMMIVNHMSCEQGLLAQAQCLAINTLCLTLIDSESRELLKTLNTQDMMTRLQQDKKVSGDKVTLVMLHAPGHLGFVAVKMDNHLEKKIKSIFDKYI